MGKGVLVFSEQLFVELLKLPEDISIFDIELDARAGLIKILLSHSTLPENIEGTPAPVVQAVWKLDDKSQIVKGEFCT